MLFKQYGKDTQLGQAILDMQDRCQADPPLHRDLDVAFETISLELDAARKRLEVRGGAFVRLIFGDIEAAKEALSSQESSGQLRVLDARSEPDLQKEARLARSFVVTRLFCQGFFQGRYFSKRLLSLRQSSHSWLSKHFVTASKSRQLSCQGSLLLSMRLLLCPTASPLSGQLLCQISWPCPRKILFVLLFFCHFSQSRCPVSTLLRQTRSVWETLTQLHKLLRAGGRDVHGRLLHLVGRLWR